MLSGNKGEWSEIYVFLKLLAEGKLNAADANLNSIPNIHYPIIKILRQLNGITIEYKIKETIEVTNSSNDKVLNLSIEEFMYQSQNLLDSLRLAKGRSFSFPETEAFLNHIYINSLSAISTDKSDIKIVVHDLNTGMQPELGFSIKSMLGKNSTLFNAGDTTNFIYEIINLNLLEQEIIDINSITDEPKISNRISKLLNLGAGIEFRDITSKNLKLNLQLIDSGLPEILSYLLLYKYLINKSRLKDLLDEINIKNPKEFDLSSGHPFYEYKLKNFLTDSALGMTPSEPWRGEYDATGGIIIVKQTGELVCYHIYNRNEFQNYLINNTKFEQASTGRYSFGEVYKENGRTYIKLNLQIRFT